MASKVETAQQAVEENLERVRSDTSIRIALPDPGLPAGRRLAEFSEGPTPWSYRGLNDSPWWAPTGICKTRVLDQLVRGTSGSSSGQLTARRHTERIGYLPQRLDHLDDTVSILDAVRQAAPNQTQTRCAHCLHDLCFAQTPSNVQWGRFLGVNGFVWLWHNVCWLTRRTSCSFSTSRRTTSIWTVSMYLSMR